MGRKELVDVEVDGVKYETEKAWLLVVDKTEMWVPKSLCEKSDDGLTFTMPEWLAKEKGLI